MATTRLPDTDRADVRELIAVVLLSVTAIFTAWAGFQSSKWSGEMSVAFSQSSAARVEASHQESAADQRQNLHVTLFAQWLQAHGAGQAKTETFVATRFPEPLHSAFTAWQATQPDDNAGAPATPFAMAEYVLPERTAAAAADQRADQHFEAGIEAHERADNYTLLTVAYASVLFFAGMSSKVRAVRSQWAMVWMGLLFFAGATTFVLAFPKLL